MVKARFLGRDFTERPLQAELQTQVLRYSRAALGGPEYAEIRVTGDRRGLWGLLEWLRAPVIIEDEYGTAQWWGFVNEVDLRVGGVQVGASLDELANNVAVAYSYVEPGTDVVGTRLTTDYAEDEASIDEYGQKDLLVSLSGSTTSWAEKVRDAVLAEKAEPQPLVQISGDAQEDSGVLYCRGWWSTLDWRYYENTGSTSTVTTTQVNDIIDDVGEFFTGVDIIDASGISTSEYQNGDRTALAVILELLQATSTGTPMLATVSTQRRVRVFDEPERAATYWLREDGRLETAAGLPVDNWECPAGFWCDLRVSSLDEANAPTVRQVLPFFVDWAEYNAVTDRLLVRARNAPGPWEIGQMVMSRRRPRDWFAGNGGSVAQQLGPFIQRHLLPNANNMFYEDFRVPVTAVNPPGLASDPDYDTTNLGYLFDDGGTEVLHIIAQMPHSWAEGSTIYPHVHWMPTNTDTGDVLWQMGYKWTNIGDADSGTWTYVYATGTGGGTAYTHQMAYFTAIAGTGKTASSILSIKLARLGGQAADTYSGDALLKEFDFHYAIDKFGDIEAT